MQIQVFIDLEDRDADGNVRTVLIPMRDEMATATVTPEHRGALTRILDARAKVGPYPNRLRQFRERAGLTQKQLADRAGVLPEQISRWEAGHRRPQLRCAMAVCRVLGVSIVDLGLHIYGSEEDAPTKPPLPPLAIPVASL